MVINQEMGSSNEDYISPEKLAEVSAQIEEAISNQVGRAVSIGEIINAFNGLQQSPYSKEGIILDMLDAHEVDFPIDLDGKGALDDKASLEATAISFFQHVLPFLE